MKVDTRGLTVHFNDGSKMSLSFPEQTDNKAAALLKLDNVLKQRYALFEAIKRASVIAASGLEHGRPRHRVSGAASR